MNERNVQDNPSKRSVDTSVGFLNGGLPVILLIPLTWKKLLRLSYSLLE